MDRRLAVYGALAPGRSNHGQLAGLQGRWRPATTRGHLAPEGWGATLGYPALVLDPAGPVVAVQLFESPDLPAHWRRLDAFEGEGYARVVVSLESPEGLVRAWIYVSACRDFPGSPSART
ncbi:MAG: gamma-glutamylcyclotransferase [Caulobacter sp.]|nr:gamma-glutamylcyclotransferase [Caulobacter sp.]